MVGEMLEFLDSQGNPVTDADNNLIRGMALNLEEDNVGAVILGSDTGIREGTTVRRTESIISVPVGPALIGRVVNAIGDPVDGKGPIVASAHMPIEARAPGVIDPPPAQKPLQTGINSVDAPSPLCRGP